MLRRFSFSEVPMPRGGLLILNKSVAQHVADVHVCILHAAVMGVLDEDAMPRTDVIERNEGWSGVGARTDSGKLRGSALSGP